MYVTATVPNFGIMFLLSHIFNCLVCSRISFPKCTLLTSDDTTTSVKYKTQLTCYRRHFKIFFIFAAHRVRLLRMKTGPAQSINVRIPTGSRAPLPPHPQGQGRFAGLESVHYSCHKGANF